MKKGSIFRRAMVTAIATSALLCAGLPTIAGAADPARPDDTYDAGHLIIKFADGASAKDVSSVLNQYKLTLDTPLEAADADLYKIKSNKGSLSIAESLKSDSRVDFAELDYDVRPSSITNDTSIANLWGLDNTGQTINGQAGTAGIDINAADAWPTTTGSGVIVGVLDEGIDISHPELASHIWTNTADCNNNGVDDDHNGYIDDCHGWDFFHNDNSVYDPTDGEDHGTHVAGTIAAAKNNSAGVAGVAPDVTIMPLKFLGPSGGSTSDAITAIQYAKDNGVRIINCSWGGGAYSQALKDAMANSGILFTTAAGNNGDNLASGPEYPASFDIANQITVAAVDNQGNLASYSNYGGTTAVGAPGNDIYSTLPKVPEASVAVDNTPSSAGWRTSFFGSGLEDFVGASTRRDLMQKELTRLGVASGDPVLIVDDDESSSGSSATPNTNGYYTAALSAAGFTNVSTVDVTKNASGPSAATMAGKTVIWQTGYAIGSSSIKTLTDADLGALTTFLDGNGKLILAGADAIWRNETATLVTDYLGITFVQEGDARTTVTGAPGGPFAGMTVSIAGTESPKSVRNGYSDIVAPRMSSADQVLTVGAASDWSAAYGYKSGTSMAAPHVAGVAALVAAILPNATAQAIVNHVRASTRGLASLGNGKTTTGGIVDSGRAVQSALGTLPGSAPPPTTGTTGTTGDANGYRFVASDGGIFSYGGATFAGSAGGEKLNQPVVGIGAKPDGTGYWLVARDGGIFGFHAPFFGSAGAVKLNQPIVGMAVTPTGNGYWLVATDGGIFSYGDARFFGSTGAIKLNKPIVGMAATPSGNGYWLIASDGGIFSYGDARFFGSTGAISLNKPIVGMAGTPSGNGYWLVASDGGIFSFGDAAFFGSTGAISLNKPIVGIASTPTGHGYWLVASDGGVFSFGDAAFFGSTGAINLNQPIVAMSR